MNQTLGIIQSMSFKSQTPRDDVLHRGGGPNRIAVVPVLIWNDNLCTALGLAHGQPEGLDWLKEFIEGNYSLRRIAASIELIAERLYAADRLLDQVRHARDIFDMVRAIDVIKAEVFSCQ